MINKKDLIKKLAKNTFLSQKEASMIFEELIDIMIAEFSSGEDISIVGFGKFYLYEHAPRPVRNPKTQEQMILDPYKSLKFKPSSNIKRLLKEETSSNVD